MYWFVVKKFLLDLWDNLLATLMFNFLYLMALAVAFFPFFLAVNETFDPQSGAVKFVTKNLAEAPPTWILPLAFLVSFSLIVLLTGIFSRYSRDMADFQKPAKKDFLPYLAQSWRSALVWFGLMIFTGLVAFTSAAFYGRLGGILGDLSAGLVYALVIFALLSLQFYFAYRNETGAGLKQTLIGLFGFFGRNPLFALFSFVMLPALFSLGFFTLFLIPGPFGLLLFSQVAYRQWRKKELWVQANPDRLGQKLYAKQVFADDIQLQGERNFKTMFQPWRN